jgi:hypothetical protein
MAKPQPLEELYSRAMEEHKYAEAASIVTQLGQKNQPCWDPLQSLVSANFIEWSGLIYTSLWGYTTLRHEYAPYDAAQFRWRKHIFFLDRKAPIAMKSVGAYAAFCLMMKGVSNKKG